MAAKIGRNAPCPCGSGAKYKKCCLSKDEAAQREQAAARRERDVRRAPREVLDLAIKEMLHALEAIVLAVGRAAALDEDHLTDACFDLGLDPEEFAEGGDRVLLETFVALAGAYRSDSSVLEQEVLEELEDPLALHVYTHVTETFPAVWDIDCDGGGFAVAREAFGPRAGASALVVMIGPRPLSRAGRRFVVGHLMEHCGVQILLMLAALRGDQVADMASRGHELLSDAVVEGWEDPWEALGEGPALAALDPARRMRLGVRRYWGHPVLGPEGAQRDQVAQELAEWLVHRGQWGAEIQTARGACKIGPVRARIAMEALDDLARCLEAVAAADVEWRGDATPGAVESLVDEIFERLGTDRQGRIAAFDEAEAVRRPVAALLLDPSHPVHAAVGVRGSISRALAWADRAPGDAGAEVRAAWASYRRELRWASLAGGAAEPRQLEAQYGARVAALLEVFDARLRALPLAELGLSRSIDRRLRAALAELRAAHGEDATLASLPTDALLLFACKGFGRASIEGVTAALSELLASWRSRLAGAPLEPPVRRPRDEEAARSLADGLDELVGLFG